MEPAPIPRDLQAALAPRLTLRREIGRGGMGVVYLAMDERHHRRVAVKVLDPSVASAIGAARFLDEIRTTASLAHPHIIPLIDSGEVADTLYYVMPFLEGESLAARLAKRSRLPVGEALRIAEEIADALSFAHAQGVLHRDVKPANILLISDHHAALADFGIARATYRARARGLTRQGGVVGTERYMSPEQAAGLDLDGRTDIFSLGVVLHEMLVGAPPAGPTRTGGVRAARPDVSHALDAVVSKATAWSPDDRFATAGELQTAIRSVAAGVRPAGRAERPMGGVKGVAAALGLAILTVTLVAYWPERTPALPEAETRFTMTVPAATPLLQGPQRSFAVSPSGEEIVYVGSETGGGTALYRRRLAEAEAYRIAGTEGGAGPIFSPDGRWVAFFADGGLLKVPSSGGTPVRLATAPAPRGASWGDDDHIVFAPNVRSGLVRVSSSGGPTTVVSRIGEGEITHRWPHVLPGSRTVLYTVYSEGMASFDEAAVVAHSLDAGRRRTITHGTAPMWAGGGTVLVARGKQLHGAAFSEERLALVDEPTAALDDVVVFQTSGKTLVDRAADGTLVYLSYQSVAQTALVLVGPGRDERELTQADEAFRSPRLSPDGGRVAVGTVNRDGTSDIWVYDLARGTRTPVSDGGLNSRPVWSPDGRSLVYAARPDGGPGVHNIVLVAADGTGESRLLQGSPLPQLPSDWLEDGSIVYEQVDSTGRSDVWTRSPAGQREPVLQGTESESLPRVSHDGTFLAYVSDRSGSPEVHVRALGPDGPGPSVTIGAGTEPVWADGGHRLFFRAGDDVLAVSLRPGVGAPLLDDPPIPVVSGVYEPGLGAWGYDVLGDGRELVMVRSARVLHLRVIARWHPLPSPDAGR